MGYRLGLLFLDLFWFLSLRTWGVGFAMCLLYDSVEASQNKNQNRMKRGVALFRPKYGNKKKEKIIYLSASHNSHCSSTLVMSLLVYSHFMLILSITSKT